MSYSDPNIFFRYKYLNPDNDSLKIISDGTLKFADASGFNDPFDSIPAYDLDSINKLPQARPDLFKRLRQEKGLTPSEYFRTKPRYINNVMQPVMSGDWARDLYSRVGILCLSREPCSMLMWSHYAAQHAGFMVELKFDFRFSDKHIRDLAPLPVEYSEKRPVLPWGCKKKNTVEKYFLTKCADWSYEEEERVIDQKRGPGIYPYERKRLLSSVIAGVRVSADHYLALQEAVDSASEEIGRKINLYRAALSPDSYRIYIPDHPNPKLSAPSLE